MKTKKPKRKKKKTVALTITKALPQALLPPALTYEPSYYYGAVADLVRRDNEIYNRGISAPGPEHYEFFDLFMKIFKHDPFVSHVLIEKDVASPSWETILGLVSRPGPRGSMEYGVCCPQCHLTVQLPPFIDWFTVWKARYKATDIK